MAEETHPPTSAEPAPPPTEVAVVSETAPPPPPEDKATPESTVTETAEKEDEKKPDPEQEKAPAENAGDMEAPIAQSVSFKEESNLVSDLADPEKKALDELKQLVLAAIQNNEFVLPAPPPPPPPPAAAEESKPAEEEKPKSEEQPKPEEPVEAPKTEEPPKPAGEEEAAAPPAAAEDAAEKTVVIEEDGAKTVEAIEETVVSVSSTTVVTETEKVAEKETPEPPPAAEEAAAEAEAVAPPPEEVLIWAVPLVGDERSDTVLLKFLRAREFKVKEAMTMIKNAVLWRKQFGIDSLLDQDLGLPEMDHVVFTCGTDKEGHPVCYNVYGEFLNKELYEKAFGDDEKRQRFLKWRIQYLERGIRNQLDFSPGGVCSMVQVTDLKNAPSLGKHRQVTRQALSLLQDNYPEFIAKKVFINVPWWYLTVNRMMNPFLTQRTKSKFVFAGPSKSAETLFRYIAPEQVPVQFGGLYKENETEFSVADSVTELTIKASSKHTIDIPLSENSLLVWEIRVLGCEVSYGAEFVPDTEGGYTVIVQKTRKLALNDEPVIKGSFKTGESGKVVLCIDNPSSKKKKVLYRFKTRSSTECTV